MPIRFLDNHAGSESVPLLSFASTPDNLLKEALETLIKEYHPTEHYPADELLGIWSGPTGIAYLFLRVGTARPHLIIKNHHAKSWARTYVKEGTRSESVSLMDNKHCGIGCETLAYLAVKAAITKDISYVSKFIRHLPGILDSKSQYPDELLYGRAGTLYLLRLMAHWVPDAANDLRGAIATLANFIFRRGPDWKWHGKRYLGAVHGGIGIITQLLLSCPELAPKAFPKLRSLLDLQLADGNWPSSVEKLATSSSDRQDYYLMQFCHGASGFVISLLSIKPIVSPDLQSWIDEAVTRARDCIWKQGVLRKEPSLCHGLFGNAL